MANDEHVKVVKAGAKAIEAWRDAHPDERLDLQEADLSGADLTGAFLFAADLTEADLTEANLTEANLSGADLTQALLSGAIGLEVSQLARASIDDATSLPLHIELPRQEIEEAHRAYEEERARERDD